MTNSEIPTVFILHLLSLLDKYNDSIGNKYRTVVLQVKMPSLSPTMTEGTIVKWAKAEGDEVRV